MKTFLIRSAAGIGFGAVLMLIIANAIYLSGSPKLDGAIFLKNTIGMVICGWLFAVTPLIFEMESLKLHQQTALHFIIVAIVYFIIAGWVGWFALNAASIAIFAGTFLLIYTAIWLGFYLYFRRIARQLNDSLKLN